MLFEREVSDMKNKLRKALLGELCALCVQVQTVYAIELPIIPVEESHAETTAAVTDAPRVPQKTTEQEKPAATTAAAAGTTAAAAGTTAPAAGTTAPAGQR